MQNFVHNSKRLGSFDIENFLLCNTKRSHLSVCMFNNVFGSLSQDLANFGGKLCLLLGRGDVLRVRQKLNVATGGGVHARRVGWDWHVPEKVKIYEIQSVSEYRAPECWKNPDSGDLKTGQYESFFNGKAQNI